MALEVFISLNPLTAKEEKGIRKERKELKNIIKTLQASHFLISLGTKDFLCVTKKEELTQLVPLRRERITEEAQRKSEKYKLKNQSFEREDHRNPNPLLITLK